MLSLASKQALVTMVLFVTIWQQPTIGNANNNYFLPGDSFFHAVLTEAVLADIAKSKSPVFKYDRPDHLNSFFCGYAGFEQLQVKDMSPAIKKNLTVLYRHLREAYPLQIELIQETKLVRDASGGFDNEVKTGKMLRREMNGFSMFFYNADFDADRYRLGLKYNENWVEQVVAFGHRQEHVQFEFFVREEEAILSDWRDCRLVKPLDVISPPITKRRSSNPLPPITLKSKVRIFVLPEADFNAAFDRSGFVYEISEAGVQIYGQGRGGKWKTRPYDEDLKVSPAPGKGGIFSIDSK
ncbi:MAG: hypothetical protein GY888_12520 [Planctomycetaceae bacterium]|nr:hypothetical protein [Planctomycetaceae bacterium]